MPDRDTNDSNQPLTVGGASDESPDSRKPDERRPLPRVKPGWTIKGL